MTKYPEQPVPGVGVVFFKENNVLVIKRRNPPRKGQWSIPGGKQKLGETWQDTAKREVREETGIEIRLIGLVDVVDAIIEDDKKNKNGKINRGPLRKKTNVAYHYTLIDCAAYWESGSLMAGSDATEAEWWPIDRLKELQLWSETERIIQKAKSLRNKEMNVER